MIRPAHLLLLPCCALCAAAEPCAPAAAEQELDRFVSLLEDVAAALGSVRDTQEAELVAPRVAADFIAIKALHETVHGMDDSGVSADFIKSYATRGAQARSATEAAVKHLRENACFESRSLPLALSFAGLLTDKLSDAQAASAVTLLLADNREQMTNLLARVGNAESAEQVAELLQPMLTCDAALAAFAHAHAESGVPEEVARRLNAAEQGFTAAVRALNSREYCGNAALRELLQPRL